MLRVLNLRGLNLRGLRRLCVLYLCFLMLFFDANFVSVVIATNSGTTQELSWQRK